MINSALFAVFVVAAGLAGQTSAALLDRGSDMVFDDATGLTWQRGARDAAGSSFDDGDSPVDGRLSFGMAQSWAAQLVVTYGGAQIDDWRLPDFLPSASGELSRLMQQSLGNSPGFVPVNWGPFVPIQSFAWTGSANEMVAPAGTFLSVEGWVVREPVHVWPPELAWAYAINDGAHLPGVVRLGLTTGGPYQQEGYAWAVRAGDVALVPEPATSAMLLVGFGAVFCATRRQNTHSSSSSKARHYSDDAGRRWAA